MQRKQRQRVDKFVRVSYALKRELGRMGLKPRVAKKLLGELEEYEKQPKLNLQPVEDSKKVRQAEDNSAAVKELLEILKKLE